MKISPLLAALGGGAVGLGLSQGGMGGGAAALPPMLALLLAKNKGGSGSPQVQAPVAPEAPAYSAPPSQGMTAQPIAKMPVPPMASVAAGLPQAQVNSGMDTDKRQQLAQWLLQLGGNMGGFGAQRY